MLVFNSLGTRELGIQRSQRQRRCRSVCCHRAPPSGTIPRTFTDHGLGQHTIRAKRALREVPVKEKPRQDRDHVSERRFWGRITSKGRRTRLGAKASRSLLKKSSRTGAARSTTTSSTRHRRRRLSASPPRIRGAGDQKLAEIE